MTQNITAALSACTKPAHRATPKPIADVEALSQKIAGHGPAPIADLIAALVASTPQEWDAQLELASLEYARRQFLAHARAKGLSAALDARLVAATEEALPEVLARLAPVFADAAAALTRSAPELPAGPAALDPATVLEADAGSAFHEARAALATLANIARAHNVRLRTDGSTPHGTDVVTLVAIPETEVERIHPLSNAKLNPPAVLEVNHQVRRLVADYNAAPNLALLDVARGEYGPGLALDLARTSADVADRVTRVAHAHLAKRLREHEA